MLDRKTVYTPTPLLRRTTDTTYTSAFSLALYLKLKYYSDHHIVFIMQEHFKWRWNLQGFFVGFSTALETYRKTKCTYTSKSDYFSNRTKHTLLSFLLKRLIYPYV